MESQEDDVDAVTSVDVDKLLFYVQNNPPIYNASLKEHHNVDVMSKIWNDIGKELSVPGNICKKKWTNLRGSYVRYVKELKKTPSGSMQLKKKWHLFDAMSFLQPWIGTTRKMTGSLDDSLKNNTDVTQDISNELQAEGEVEVAPKPLIENQNNFNPSKKQRRTTADIVAAPMVEYLKTVTEKRKAGEEKSDSAMLTFFKSLVSDAETLSPKRQRLFKSSVMAKLHSLLDDQDSEQSRYTPSPASVASSSSSTLNHQFFPLINQLHDVNYNDDTTKDGQQYHQFP
ncbi:hypothetical protein LSTR_LSTR010781 [Laodelphax striatellus]|uniref:MADF domain-containing protein n=2 Tax=Laodelphax striatellus TaxID=195883 RepID=A0A482XE36_LAOST|nr:hypothetical protein LSTR_LSTR010781 [Laodelphax striatellus]